MKDRFQIPAALRVEHQELHARLQLVGELVEQRMRSDALSGAT